ncbi:general secretion pathway protein A [Luteimonas cucumeris]|uniref:General secretion pathway protein A n=1 Tax=Luteimonas cucumeris TaxID=985012 RepID=A0A562LF30_9GAMM|nr:ExeA family protein [Luteimonas cucumeris]TWI06223.1 general secretion pathway protein A [Luteimonas cucumeris]
MNPHGAHVAAYLAPLALARAPFPPTPDAEGYFHTAALERDLAEASHCLLARKGFVLLTGEVGMGKSTFLRRLLNAVEREGAVASLVFNTFLQGPELLAAILRDFGIEASADAADNIDRLNRFLLRRWQDGHTCVVVIDDAQNLSLESLELLRLLSGLESGQEKLLQIVLAGQPELDAQLARPEIRQLTSRIIKHIRMDALDAAECARYVEFRLTDAGAAGRIRIDPAAHAALYRASGGNPRRIHLIMDRCLYGVVARGQPHIDAALVRAAAAEAGFQPQRRRSRRPLLLAVALLATTGLVTATGIALRPDAVLSKPVTVAAITAPSTAATATDANWNTCLQQLTPADDSGQTLQVLPLPPRHHAALSKRTDVCLQRRNDGWLAAWQPQLRAAELQPGRRNDQVRALQARLQAGGFLAVDAALADGLFGPVTREALTRFQHHHGVTADGVADPLTLLLLETATTRTSSAARPERPHGHG